MRPAGWKLFGHAMFELSQLNVTEVAEFGQRNFQNLFTKGAPPGKQIRKIKARGGYLYGTWIRGLGSIACGVAPFGYTQVRPKDETPPPLVEGQKYSYLVDTTNAPGASGY